MNDELNQLTNQVNELASIVRGLGIVLDKHKLNLNERTALQGVMERLDNELNQSRAILKPLRAEQREKTKIAKKEQKRRKARAKALLNRAMNARKKSEKRQRDKIHKISKLNQVKPHMVQGGAPGLGKKS